MIKSYNYNSVVRLSDNFVTSEFRCKCGKPHSTLISTELVNGLQQLINVLGASKAIVTSGYRCPEHDKAVGGNGKGQHTLGRAADVKFYDRAGNAISTKLVACKAQELGFTGIANIDKTYTAIHLDVRTSGKWFGDEVRGTSVTVTDDFYKYYDITRSDSTVKALQTALNTLGYKLLTVDGICGYNTLKAARKCIVDNGTKNEVVKWVQNRLNSLGFDCGSPDGIAGKKTMSAINSWQKANKLGEGYLGGSDWDKLIGA